MICPGEDYATNEKDNYTSPVFKMGIKRIISIFKVFIPLNSPEGL